jgi:hypothetical protein
MSHGSLAKGAGVARVLSTIEAAAEISKCPDLPGSWRVAGPEVEGGDNLVAVFSGPHSRERATEYAFAKFVAVLE